MTTLLCRLDDPPLHNGRRRPRKLAPLITSPCGFELELEVLASEDGWGFPPGDAPHLCLRSEPDDRVVLVYYQFGITLCGHLDIVAGEPVRQALLAGVTVQATDAGIRNGRLLLHIDC